MQPRLSGTDSKSGPASAAERDEPEPVAQPLQRGAGHEDAPLEREDVVGRRCARRPSPAGRRRDRARSAPTLTSRNEPVPYVFLDMPGSTHACPKSAACWSPAIAADRDAQAEKRRRVGRPDRPGARLDRRAAPRAGCRRARRARDRNHRGRGRTGASGSRCSASVARTAPPVSRAMSQVSTVARADLAALRASGERRVLAEQPLELRGGEVRVEQQSGPAPDLRLLAAGAMLGADPGAAPALPDDRRGDRFERSPVEDDERLALVGDADRGRVAHRSRGAAPRTSRPPTPRAPMASCSTHPSCGCVTRTSRCARAAMWPSGLTSRQVVPEVP